MLAHSRQNAEMFYCVEEKKTCNYFVVFSVVRVWQRLLVTKYFAADCDVREWVTYLTWSLNTLNTRRKYMNSLSRTPVSETRYCTYMLLGSYALHACPSLWSNTNIRTHREYTWNGACCKEQKCALGKSFKVQILGAGSNLQLPAEKPANIHLCFCTDLTILSIVSRSTTQCVPHIQHYSFRYWRVKIEDKKHISKLFGRKYWVCR
jgi:hypothetical protein